MEVARWETKGKDYLSLLDMGTLGFKYQGNGCGGYLKATTVKGAIEEMERGPVKVLMGNRKSLKRVR